MGLRDLDLRFQYRPNEGNLVDEFYLPCLSRSILYRRAVGYFTSGSLALAARGLSVFIGAAGGHMELVASPALTPGDQDAIRFGYGARADVVARCLLRQLQPNENDIINQRLGFLAWLIAHDRLDIKIALLADVNRHGIYHEKIGVFQDAAGDTVAFTGSSNETEGGLYSNFETLEVFCSWREGDSVRVQNKVRDFQDLWSNNTRYLEIVEFPEAAKRGLLDFAGHYKPDAPEPESETLNRNPWVTPRIALPAEVSLRDYQKEAVKEWFRNAGSGILEMATGTGKTITALTATLKALEVRGRLGLIVVAPYTHLVDQWEQEARRFGFRPILAYKARQSWETEVVAALTAFQMDAANHYCVITTAATFLSRTMQAVLERVVPPTMLIADEAHHLGAQHLRSTLPDQIPYRLALSATPERWYDNEGTEALNSYFAPGVIFEYGLKEAIAGGFLTPYQYYPHLVEMTDEENEEYRGVTRQIVKLIGNQERPDMSDQRLQNLLIARARIVNRAENKLDVLKELVLPERESHHNLFYCGDAKVDGERQIDRVIKLLGHGMGMKVHPFTAQEGTEERQYLLSQFESGQLQGLVAIRCLDEGVDVPATRTAYILASSTNPREFIQRRGRILRRHPSKNKAVIHDFIVIPRSIAEVRTLEPAMFNLERRLVRRELQRVAEFAGLAENGPQATLVLQPLKAAFHLLDM